MAAEGRREEARFRPELDGHPRAAPARGSAGGAARPARAHARAPPVQGTRRAAGASGAARPSAAVRRGGGGTAAARWRRGRFRRRRVHFFAPCVRPRQRRGANVQLIASHVSPRRPATAARPAAAPAPAWRPRETPGEGDAPRGRRPDAAMIGAGTRPAATRGASPRIREGPKVALLPLATAAAVHESPKVAHRRPVAPRQRVSPTARRGRRGRRHAIDRPRYTKAC